MARSGINIHSNNFVPFPAIHMGMRLSRTWGLIDPDVTLEAAVYPFATFVEPPIVCPIRSYIQRV